jgi:hypothetical protein
LGRFIRRGSLLRARGAGSARAQQLYLQRRGEFVTAPFLAAGCAAVTRQANGVKVGQKARGVQISRRWSNQKIRVTPRNAKWCREEVVEIFLRRYSGLCQPNYALNIPGGHGKPLTANRYSCPLI